MKEAHSVGSHIKKWQSEGLSLRQTFIVMFAVSVSITVILLYATVMAFRTFRALSVAADNYIELQSDASSLLEASDYLTEQAQRYSTIGNRLYLDNYITEAEVSRRRETAIDVMKKRLPASDALTSLENAMKDSNELEEREYYAMALVLEAKHDHDIPASLADVKISAEDAALSDASKMLRAARMTHDEDYYAKKNEIRTNLSVCIDDLKALTRSTQETMEQNMLRDLSLITLFVIIQSFSLLFLVFFTTRLGINPLVQAVERIRNDQQLPIIGAREFRYLAGTYNKMYSAYKRSIEKLSFKASHDELTGLYNRAGFDLIQESVDPENSAFLMIDVDFFKQVNDSHGHETGDLVLKKVAAQLKSHFRSDDHIFRLGGDEFAVIMVHVGNEVEELIREKIERINANLADTSDGLPPISVSVGVSLCGTKADAHEMFQHSDIALYEVKKNGRHGVRFYRPDMHQFA